MPAPICFQPYTNIICGYPNFNNKNYLKNFNFTHFFTQHNKNIETKVQCFFDKIYYLFENCGALRAPFNPGFFLSLTLESRVTNPALFKIFL